MQINDSMKNDVYNATLSGRFTFGDHQEFRIILQKIQDTQVRQVVLHMQGVEFVDSAALGMLMLAYEEAGKYKKQLTINGVSGQVQKVFEITRLDTLFSMPPSRSAEG